jgi:enoyl-[acyl-carrier protein] reductase II
LLEQRYFHIFRLPARVSEKTPASLDNPFFFCQTLQPNRNVQIAAPLFYMLTTDFSASFLFGEKRCREQGKEQFMKTRITEMLGIDYPIVQGGMAYLATPELVAAVSNAGGFGLLTVTMFRPDEVGPKIEETRKLTDKPFGINITPTCETLGENLDACIEAKAFAVTYGRGRYTTDMVMEKLKPEGILCFPIIGNLKQAVRVEEEGADGIIASGYEGGGHTGYVATIPLVTQVIDRVKIPVVACGGIVNGKGLAAALAMGAEGVQMGTRFACTQESPAHANYKQTVIDSSGDDSIVTGAITGVRMRCLRNKLTETFENLESKKATAREFDRAGLGKLRAALLDGDCDFGSLACTQSSGAINDIPTCSELIQSMVAESKAALENARRCF